MKIRILSDLHLDVNARSCFKLRGEQKDVFTVIAGDTSGDPVETIDWLKKNVKRGVFINGNHLVYNSRHKTIDELRHELAFAFPAKSDITYLDAEVGNMSKEVEGILFIGTCLYTDFKLNCGWSTTDNVQDRNMSLSWRMMNDYRWGIKEHDLTGIGRDKPITPKDYLEWFNHGFASIKKLVEDNEKLPSPKPVVIITHHAPTKDCISGHYVDSASNASYASDLEWFIKKHPSIKCWVYGHIHADQKEVILERDDGTMCVIVNNARGYVPRLEDTNFNVNTFLDTDTWTVTRVPLSKSQLAKRKKQADEYIRTIAPFCF